MKSERGQISVIIALILVVFAGFLATLVWLTRSSTRAGIHQSRADIALRLAEAAAERGVWKLRESDAIWESIASGPLSGYNNDVAYTDDAGGEYKIKISVGELSSRREIVGTGKEEKSGTYRAVKVIVEKQKPVATVHANLFNASGSVVTFWGPLMSLTNIDMSGAANQLYPRKYARGAITASGGYPTRDDNPSEPNKDSGAAWCEWWSYSEGQKYVPDIPDIDFEYYRQEAQSDGEYYDTPPSKQTISNEVDTTPKTRFFEGDVKFTGSKYFCGDLIVMGDCEFSGSGESPEGNITVTPHAEAWKEYQKNCPIRAGVSDDGDYSDGNDADGDSSSEDEYPGDDGLHTVKSYTFGDGTGGASGNPLSFNGFLYVKGNLKTTGSSAIYGTIIVETGSDWGTGSCEYFFNDSQEVTYTSERFNVTSWAHVEPSTTW